VLEKSNPKDDIIKDVILLQVIIAYKFFI